MTDRDERPENCGGCAYWRKIRDSEGVCSRRAPEPTSRPESVAHWPQTRRSDGCGDGLPAARFSRGVYCANCLHWRRPEQGLNPVNRGDMPMAWWARAGRCTRHAPRPVDEPGPRGFWPATLDIDFCADGEEKRHEGES